MIQTRNIILKIYIISFPIYELSRLLDMQQLHIARKIEQNSSGTRLTFCFILKLETIQFYFLLLVFIRCTNPVIGCHSLSLVITRCHSLLLVVIRFHSIYHSLSFVVSRCHSLHLLLSFAVPLVAIRCHLLYHSLLLVFTRCTTRLSFYKRS